MGGRCRSMFIRGVRARTCGWYHGGSEEGDRVGNRMHTSGSGIREGQGGMEKGKLELWNRKWKGYFGLKGEPQNLGYRLDTWQWLCSEHISPATHRRHVNEKKNQQ